MTNVIPLFKIPSPEACLHARTAFDKNSKELWCAECGEVLDKDEYLARLSAQYSPLRDYINLQTRQASELTERIKTLREEELALSVKVYQLRQEHDQLLKERQQWQSEARQWLKSFSGVSA